VIPLKIPTSRMPIGIGPELCLLHFSYLQNSNCCGSAPLRLCVESESLHLRCLSVFSVLLSRKLFGAAQHFSFLSLEFNDVRSGPSSIFHLQSVSISVHPWLFSSFWWRLCRDVFVVNFVHGISSLFPSYRKFLRYLIDTDTITAYSAFDDFVHPG